MEKYIANSFNYDYAVAWSARQGEFSFNLAKNLINYLNKNGVKVDSCLDICCGTGEFLSVMKRLGAKCTGTEIAKSMIEFCQNKYDGMNFIFTEKIDAIKTKEKFDLISCNHDMVNSLETLPQWEKLFKTAKSLLVKDGLFVFDFYTKTKLENWNTTTYEQSNDMDYVKDVKPKLGKSIIQEIYYVKKTPELYEKTSDILVESYFETAEIIKTLEKVGFKDIKALNFTLENNADLENASRIHIIAK